MLESGFSFENNGKGLVVKLLIVESPGKIKKLRSFLGGGWDVAASVGHICDLPQKEIGISFDADKVRLALVVTPDRKETVSKLQAAAAKAGEIYLATDPDREGEAIAYHVGLQLGKDNWSKIKRVAFNEISEKAVLAAVGLPRRIDMALVNAQQARRVVDRLVGYRVSPLLWSQDGIGTSAGRVQSVAVRLVVEREQEVRAFVPEEFWTIEAELFSAQQGDTAKKQTFKSKLHSIDGKVVVSRVEEGKERQQCKIASEQEAKKIIGDLQGGDFTVSAREEKPQTRKPPAPFVTSSLQQAAHGALKWDASKTMQVAQKLYEAGLITYMRTDSPLIAPEAVQMVRRYISDSFGAAYLPEKPQVYVARDKRSQEAHECIRPVQVVQSAAVSSLPMDESRLFQLIWKQFVACQMADAQYDTGVLSISALQYLFQVRGRQLRFDGWTRILGELGDGAPDAKKTAKTGGSEEELVLLPPVQVGDALTCKALLPTKAATKPPLRYSEARLIKTLEQRSIGRPSTYASILKTIKARGYVVDKQRVLHATPVGEGLVGFLMSGFDSSFMDYHFTARMEDTLDSIAAGEAQWEQMAREFDSGLSQLLKTGSLSQFACPKCGSAMRRRKGKNGDFFGCSGYPECRHTSSVAPVSRAN
jgi:DNA topoisomerase I